MALTITYGFHTLSRLRIAAIILSAILLSTFMLGIFIIPRWQKSGTEVPASGTAAAIKPCAPRVYPPESLRAGEQGIAWIGYTTGPDGTVVSAEVERSSGYARLDAASLEHIRTCRFRSGGHSGTVLYKWFPY